MILLLVSLPAITTTNANDTGVSREEEPITPIPEVPPLDPAKLSLGELLFRDPRLSKDGSQACASCHDVTTNGANSRQRDTASGGSELPFNTITVFNAALNFRLNWEGNFRTLESHAETIIDGRDPADTGIYIALKRLNADAQIVSLFMKAYGAPPDKASLIDAISTYERSLLTPGSRFDRWLRGDASAMSAEETEGYALFKSLGCVSCHQGVAIGGNLFQRHGIFRPLASALPEILRVPSLRNIATTAPYFHDGSAPTLDDAVEQMAVAQLNRNLSREQIAAIVAYLNTLTGTYRGKAVTAPSP